MFSEIGDKGAPQKDAASEVIEVPSEADVGSEGKYTSVADVDHADMGLDAYTQALRLDPEDLQRLAKKALWKLDFILLPLASNLPAMMCLIFMTAFLEKAALNFANAYSMQQDLGLVGRQFAWTASIASLGAVIGSYPGSLAVQKLPVGKLVSGLVVTWGVLSMCLAAAKNFATIFAIRFILGLTEAGIGPAWVILTSMFWTRDEQPLRMCFWLGSNGFAQLIGAGISTGLGSVDNTEIRPWQLIFLVLGTMAIVLGIVCFFLLPSSPSNARFLTKEEQLACVWRIAQNQTGIKNEKFLKYQAYEALCDFRVWCLLVQQFCIGLANGSLTNYFSAFLKGFGWSSMDALKYQLPIGGIQVVATIFAGYLASRFRNCTIIIILVLATFGVAALVGWSTIPAKHKMALTACTWLVAPYGATIILNWAVVAANFAGHTKRTTINGINFAAFWAGNFAGPFVFDPSEAPRYPTATRILGGMIGLGWVATAAMGLYMWNANRRRDAKAAAGNYAYTASEGELGGFTDRTDKENKSFRYRL